MLRRAAPVVALGLSLLAAAPGCKRDTAQAGCRRYVDAINAMLERCGYSDRFVVVTPEGRIGCDEVDRYAEGGMDRIEGMCIPWTETATCDEFAVSGDRILLPEFCAPSNFQYVVHR